MLCKNAKANSACNSNRSFDSTRGFPGEGWPKFQLATWNCRSLTFERFEYCKSLGFDVLVLTELWRKQSKFQTSTNEFIVGQARVHEKGPNKGKLLFPDDG